MKTIEIIFFQLFLSHLNKDIQEKLLIVKNTCMASLQLKTLQP